MTDWYRVNRDGSYVLYHCIPCGHTTSLKPFIAHLREHQRAGEDVPRACLAPLENQAMAAYAYDGRCRDS